MRKNENKTSKFVCIVLLLCVIAMILVAGTYAKYVSSAKGTAKATVAGWDIKVNGTKLGVTEETITFDLFNGLDKVAPGDSGSVTVPVVNNSDVDAEFGVAFNVTGTAAPIQYSLDGVTYGADLDDVDATSIAKGATENVTVYWKWVTESDAADTALGIAGGDSTVEATITVSQAQ